MGLCERHFRGNILTFADVIFLIDCESIYGQFSSKFILVGTWYMLLEFKYP